MGTPEQVPKSIIEDFSEDSSPEEEKEFKFDLQEFVEGEDGEKSPFEIALQEQMHEMLADIEAPEGFSEQFQEVYRLHTLVKNLDSEDTDNSLRHVARAASDDLEKKRSTLNQLTFIKWNEYLLKNETPDQTT